MFYTVASPECTPGFPLCPTGTYLFRTRAEVDSLAPGAPTIAVAIHFDEDLRSVRPNGGVARALARDWAAPAVPNTMGGVTVLGPIPEGLVRSTSESGPQAEWRPRPATPDCATDRDEDDLMMMALLA